MQQVNWYIWQSAPAAVGKEGLADNHRARLPDITILPTSNGVTMASSPLLLAAHTPSDGMQLFPVPHPPLEPEQSTPDSCTHSLRSAM